MPGNRTNLKADAILFATSKIGVMAIECIASLGLKIPDDVALHWLALIMPMPKNMHQSGYSSGAAAQGNWKNCSAGTYE